MYIDELVKVCEKAWAFRALALIGEGTPIRVAVLAAAAGTTRSSMRPSIQHLFDLDLLTENQGHGHPLRPDARLTTKGKRWAKLAMSLEEVLPVEEDSRLIRLNWTLPTLRVAHSRVRFVSLRQALAPVRDTALSNTLRRLETSGWIERRVDTEFRPPQVAYIAVKSGREIADLLHEKVKIA